MPPDEKDTPEDESATPDTAPPEPDETGTGSETETETPEVRPEDCPETVVAPEAPEGESAESEGDAATVEPPAEAEDSAKTGDGSDAD